MKPIHSLVSLLAPLALSMAHGAVPEPAARWINADEVRVRSGPSAEDKVLGTLALGAQLILRAPTDSTGYCLIEGEGPRGYVACAYLSVEPVARARAGQGGIAPTQRWVTGNSVTLREAPRGDAQVTGRLSLNTVVQLLAEEAGSGYCQVQPASGPSGFTACRYLAPTPVVLARIRGEGNADATPSEDYDPVRAFWLQPSWGALEAYAEELRRRHPELPPGGPWPRDDALEAMKAHLALGLKGGKPAPYVDWSALKRLAGRDLDLSGQAHRLQDAGKPVPAELSQRAAQMTNVAWELQSALGLWGPLHDAIEVEGAARLIRLVRVLELPTVGKSLFRQEADLAPPGSSTEEASGRFGIVFRQLVSARKPKADIENTPGLYDMLSRSQLLVRPVQQIQLFRDGRILSEPSLLRRREILWREIDEPMCEGWTPGFAYGDADASIWRYFSNESVEQAALNDNPRGSIYQFYTAKPLPRQTAVRSETRIVLDRDSTGFVRGTHLFFDLDADGIADLTIFEGQGRGPGHLGTEPTTDDKWFRLVLANINGAWKVLGSDVFSYGCGC